MRNFYFFLFAASFRFLPLLSSPQILSGTSHLGIAPGSMDAISLTIQPVRCLRYLAPFFRQTYHSWKLLLHIVISSTFLQVTGDRFSLAMGQFSHQGSWGTARNREYMIGRGKLAWNSLPVVLVLKVTPTFEP